MNTGFIYETDCVSANGNDIQAMKEWAVPISLDTVRRKCLGFSDWCKRMGYGNHLPISKDWHVSYYKSAYRGKKCYYVVHSAIEHIWVENV